MAHELLLKGGLVVTVDHSLGDLPDADVLIRDGEIVAVAPGLSTSSKNAEVIDCKGRLVNSRARRYTLLTHATTMTAGHVAGFISASFHHSLDGTKAAVYAQWRSK